MFHAPNFDRIFGPNEIKQNCTRAWAAECKKAKHMYNKTSAPSADRLLKCNKKLIYNCHKVTCKAYKVILKFYN